MPTPFKAVAFDAYGTLFDVYSISRLAENLFPGHGDRIAATWRDKQIEYTRLRTMCDRYEDFWKVTEDALEYACALFKCTLTPENRRALMGEYAKLSAFPENRHCLQKLKTAGLPMAILSNGTPRMLDTALASSGLTAFFDHVLSVEAVGRFKTAPQAYQLGPDAFGCAAKEILFVSSNCWDVCGATWFGYTTLWLNRYDLPLDRLGVAPSHMGTSLDDVARVILAQN